MSRLVVLIIIAVVLIGALFFLSTLPKQQPTQTIEVAVPQPAPSGGNAH
jgi:hypothetical protein